LFVHDPASPPVPAAPEAARQSTPKPRKDESEDEEEVPILKKKKKAAAAAPEPQMVPGVPNELLLPGAIGALAVSIILVFTISRLTSN